MLRRLGHVNTFKYLADPFSVSSKSFIWVGLLFGNYLILLKAPPPSTTSLKESSTKIHFRNSFPHNTPRLCARTSLEGAFVERENSQPITSWHVILPSPQNIANYKAPCITARFCYHYSEANGNLTSVMQKPITHQRMCKWWHKQPRTCKRWHKQSSTCKWWHKWTNQAVTCVTNQTPPRVVHPPPNSYK